MQPVLFSLVREVGSHDPNFLSLSGLSSAGQTAF